MSAAPLFTAGLRLAFTIESRNREGAIVPPRTKKNSPQIIPHMKHPILVPSEAYREWHRGAKAALRQLIQQLRAEGHALPIDYPVNCAATIYRDRLVGDTIGYMQGLADFLADDVGNAKLGEMRLLADDKWIVTWDGTRADKDAARPRVEVVLTAVNL